MVDKISFHYHFKRGIKLEHNVSEKYSVLRVFDQKAQRIVNSFF